MPSWFTDDRVTVAYADLDISSDSGAAALYARLKAASEKACGTEGYRSSRSIKANQAAHACYDELMGRLVSRLSNDKVTAIHES